MELTNSYRGHKYGKAPQGCAELCGKYTYTQPNGDWTQSWFDSAADVKKAIDQSIAYKEMMKK